jgi:hypothetical protein
MRRASAPLLGVALGYALVAIAFTWPLALNLSTHLTGDPGGDTGVYVWNQWVFHHELVNAHNPLSTQKILSLTDRVDLSQHNYTAFLDVLALPLINRLGLIAAFNVVFLLMTVLNALFAYGLARQAFGVGRIEAWLAGFVFAWSPVLVARTTGHFSLVAAAPLAAFLWALVNAERSRSITDAALVGLCTAWAAFCDAYYGVYCLIIAGLHVVSTIVGIVRGETAVSRAWLWAIDVLVIAVSGLIFGMALGARGAFSIGGIVVSMRELYTPVLALTILVASRVILTVHPRIVTLATASRWPWKMALVALTACVGPMSPILYGLGVRIADGRFVSPPIFWRSSPRGVDLVAFFTPNPNHPLMRWFVSDLQTTAPTWFVEYTASFSLVAVAIVAFAVWRAGFRPRVGWWWLTIGFALLALGPFVYVFGYNTHIPGPWALLRYMTPIGLARMPPRFAVVATLGLAMLMAAALAAITTTWPHRRRLVIAIVTALLFVELWPGPRPLYSAAISAVYDTIAADPRPIRVLTLPFGVRDGVSSVGNFRPRSQFNQTRHQKPLIGGYLSRISPKRVERMRNEFPTLAVLMKLSEPQALDDRDLRTLADRGPQFVQRAELGYVVIDQRFISLVQAAPVIKAFGLREIQRDAHLVLFAVNPVID